VAHDIIGVTQAHSNEAWSYNVNSSGRLPN